MLALGAEFRGEESWREKKSARFRESGWQRVEGYRRNRREDDVPYPSQLRVLV